MNLEHSIDACWRWLHGVVAGALFRRRPLVLVPYRPGPWWRLVPPRDRRSTPRRPEYSSPPGPPRLLPRVAAGPAPGAKAYRLPPPSRAWIHHVDVARSSREVASPYSALADRVAMLEADLSAAAARLEAAADLVAEPRRWSLGPTVSPPVPPPSVGGLLPERHDHE